MVNNPFIKALFVGKGGIERGGAPEIPMFQESSNSHGRPVGFQDIFVGWPEVCALCMNAYIYIVNLHSTH